MLFKQLKSLPKNHEFVAYVGDDVSVHVWRDEAGHIVLGIRAPKIIPIAMESTPTPIRLAKPR